MRIKINHVFECYFCAKLFKTKLGHEIHMRTHTREIPWECNICHHKSYTSHSEYKNHMKKHTNKIRFRKNNYKCNLCNHNCRFLSMLRRHKYEEHSCTNVPMFFCNFCGKHYFTSNELNIHLISHTNERNFTCYFCLTKTWKSQNPLTIHLLVHHLNEKPHKCSKCHFRSHTTLSLQVHDRRIHKSQDTMRKCEHCGKSVTKRKFVQHKRHVHKIGLNSNICCYFCKEIFGIKTDLEGHMRKHTTEHHVKCKECNLRFNYHTEAKTHFVRCHV